MHCIHCNADLSSKEEDNILQKYLEQILYNQVDMLICISRLSKTNNELQGNYQDTTKVINNTRELLNKNRSRIKCPYCGRYQRRNENG